MTEISFNKSFVKSLKKLLKQDQSFEKRLKEKLNIFIDNPFNPILKTHKLSGKLKELYSFSIEFDLRILFYFYENKAVFIDIGRHADVY